MATWQEFARQAPELAAFGAQRFGSGVAYIATVAASGNPRVHPVTPIIADELYLFMEPTSPKGKDLERGSGYSLHCAVVNMNGGEGEFYVRGHATRLLDADARAKAVAAASYSPAERYVLFKLSVEFAFMNVYASDGAKSQRWEE
jgi:hypothetical protein